MKIKQKLILGFLSVTLLVAVGVYVSVHSSQKALQKTIGEEATKLAGKMLEHIDRSIYSRIEIFHEYSGDLRLQRVISESNKEFEKLVNIQGYISEKDREWTSVPKEEVTVFMKELINNQLSEELREKIGFYEDKYGYRVFGEVFATNKYGANAAQSGKTTDYYQADEQWWQNAKKDGLYVADVEYDRSANVYSTDICIRIDDEAGNFIGVIKVVLNIEETINFIRKTEEEHPDVGFKLLTKDARVFYATEEFESFQQLPIESPSISHQDDGGHRRASYFIAPCDKHGRGEELFACNYSKGYRDYTGLGWILVVEHQINKIFAPVAMLRNRILIISLTVTILAILLGLFVSTSISKGIANLRDTAITIGKGDLGAQIEVKSKDEIGELAESFNDMASKLKASHAKLKESHTQLEEKVEKRTVELTSSNKKLEEEIEQRSLTQKTLEERIKELNCLFSLSKLVEQRGIELEEILEETVGLIRNAYQYPDKTCVRITFEGVQYKTDNFEKSESSQHAQINIYGEKANSIEVYYLGEKTEGGETPFLKEEQDLLDAVAKHLGSVAERKRTGEKLQLFRDLIDRSNDCVFVIEPEWGRFLDINDRACNCLGYTREELLQMSLKDIDESVPDDSAWTQHVKEVRQKGDVVLESRHRHKDGTTFPVEMNIKFIEQEKGSYILVVAWDLTERKKAEEKKVELLKEVESVNRELKDFAYVVSHDLKAPLRGIRTIADWIGSDYADKFDDEGKEQIGLLSSRVDRMHNLIDGVLEYSRVGRVEEKQVQVNLNELVPEIIDTIAPPENIAITIEDELPVVECGQTRIMQVFQNLLSNAVKYMDKPQGQVRIGCVEENGFWRFSVADNGPGIEEKHFEKIFQIFQTLSPRDDFESTGVGLTVVKKIVELYGGKIWVESKPGEGSTFFFTLPRQEIEVVGHAKLEANIAH